MHYKINNILIKTEYAAKSPYQTSKNVLKWIATQDPTNFALDFGCGKLRYSTTLARRCRKLTLVDSGVQINRTQKIGHRVTTVREYVREHLPNARVLSRSQFERDKRKYSLAICINVLSAIPSEKSRSKALQQILRRLTAQGVCLFVTQYTNSYFRKAATSPTAQAHLDGWILITDRGNFYYGVLNKQKLESLLVSHGFRIRRSWVRGQSVYVEATSRARKE